jgi:hypothetical protein
VHTPGEEKNSDSKWSFYEKWDPNQNNVDNLNSVRRELVDVSATNDGVFEC